MFKGKTYLVTGASRGIGAAIAERLAIEGANLVIIAKTAEPNEKLPGTIFSVAQKIESLGAPVLPIALDIREAEGIQRAVEQTVQTFGGIDGLINNASALNLTNTIQTPIKRFDLMMGVNVRATFAFAQACHDFLKKAKNPHILTISPPINLNPKWFKDHLAYTISKYGMSMCTLGLAEEFKADRIAVNSLWPKTLIATSAIKNNFPAAVYQATRQPTIMADAAAYILSQPSDQLTGQFFIDEEVLKKTGKTDLSAYDTQTGTQALLDLYIE